MNLSKREKFLTFLGALAVVLIGTYWLHCALFDGPGSGPITTVG